MIHRDIIEEEEMRDIDRHNRRMRDDMENVER